MDAVSDLKRYNPHQGYAYPSHANHNNIHAISNDISNNDTYTHSNNNQMMPYLSSDYNTLKQLLQSPQSQQLMSKSALSPNGSFKYVDRESVKSNNKKYNTYPKSQVGNHDRIRRPLNCFMVFSHLERKKVAEQHPELHNADLSKILGKRWKNLTATERQPYVDEAERIRLLHTEIYPDYKYQPKRKIQVTTKRIQKKSENEIPKADSNNESEASLEENCKSDVTTTKKSNIDVSTLRCPISSKKFKETEKKTHIAVEKKKLPNFSSNSNSITQTQSEKNNLYATDYSNYVPSLQYSQLTPDLSPASCYQESIFNAASSTTPVYGGMQSLPPTPDVSPRLVDRDESVFRFDPRSFTTIYARSHDLKPVNYSDVDLICNTNESKGDMVSDQRLYTHVNVTAPIQGDNEYYHGNTQNQQYFDPQQQMFNDRNFQLSHLDVNNQLYMNDGMGFNNMSFNVGTYMS